METTEQKTDLRVQRTYRLLTQALMEMLQEQSFNTITVRGLCERAMVRPATFYKHFGDKSELFTFLVTELQREFLRENPYRDDPAHPQEFYLSLIDQTFRFFEQNRTMVGNAMRSDASALLVDLMTEQIERQVRQGLVESRQRGVELHSSPEVMAPFFTGALVHLARWWVLGDFATPREELVAQCAAIIESRG